MSRKSAKKSSKIKRKENGPKKCKKKFDNNATKKG